MALMLSSEGYDVKLIAYHGGDFPRQEIMTELSTGRYDLVIVALWNLYEILLEIRERFPDIKTIFFNTYKEQWDVIARERGVDVVLRAPEDLDRILEVVEKILKQ